MVMTDSLEKIITRYIAVVTNQEFEWRGNRYLPKPLKVSPLLLRGYTCPERCGACCPRFSLDYLPQEHKPPGLEIRKVEFNGGPVYVYSDTQTDHKDHHCRNLDKETARCKIHICRPFSCDFELIRPAVFADPESPNMLQQRLFGRAWNMTRADGSKGTDCVMTAPTEESVEDAIRKIKRLEEWCQHFGVDDNKCQSILSYIDDVRSFVGHWKVGPRTIKE